MLAGGYPRAPLAQQRASSWQSRRNNSPDWDPQERLRAPAERLLRERHSPEQIASILRNMNPDESTLLASHETIYTAL
ncbi:MAG: hypothetical protein VB142_01965 [Burkholderia sp.]